MKYTVLILAAILAVAVLASAIPATAAAKQPALSSAAGSGEMHGVVTAVNPSAKRLMISGSRHVFYLSPDAKITSNGRQVSLSQLHPGDQVTLRTRHSGSRWYATDVTHMPGSRVAGAREAQITGKIASLSAKNNRLTVGGHGQVIHVTPQTTIMSAGRQAKLSDLRPGEQVTVTARMMRGRLTATRIESGGPRQAMAGARMMSGKVESWDSRTRELRLSSSREPIYLAPNAEIMSNGRRVAATEITRDSELQVTVRSERNRLVADRVELLKPGAATHGAAREEATPNR